MIIISPTPNKTKYTRLGLFYREHDEDEMRGWTVDLLMSSVTVLVLLIVYLRTMYPSIPGGDSGESVVNITTCLLV